MTHLYGKPQLLVFALATLGLAVASQAQDNGSGGNAISGQQLYFDHACYSCHGYTGETGVRTLIGSAYLQNEEIFRTYLRLRAEQNPTLPSTEMPNFSAESLDDAAVSDLYAYIRTFRSNAPALENVPALNAIIDAASGSDEP
jgi:cytochrome c553